jgi:hypothetical protein
VNSRPAAAALAWVLGAGAPGQTVRLDGYAEWRQGDALIVDGQRVRANEATRFKGGVKNIGSIPLGDEAKATGTRQPDGSVLAKEIEAKPNGDAMFEKDLRSAFDAREQQYLHAHHMYDQDDTGKLTHDYGRLYDEGKDVERVRGIARRLVPGYLNANDFRVYVVDNKEWNAMAAPNRSVYVFSGLLKDLDDDEVAIVLGHELVHATHEHSRKQFKKQIVIQLATLGVVLGAEGVDNSATRLGLGAVASIGSSAWSNGYGRSHEDQADRVGLRYAHEAGYDVRKGPALWLKFADKYGEGNQIENFFFSDHSQSLVRAKNLETEIAFNYSSNNPR